MQRRDIIRGAVAGGLVVLVGRTAEAAPQGFFDINFEFWWGQLLNTEAQGVIKGLCSSIVVGFGRTFGIKSEGAVQIGGNAAVVHMTTRRHAAGHLVLSAHMLDGGGRRVVTHDGTAPHHRHAQMHAHVSALVGKTHSWLVAHNM